jgi:hypothetical protein
MLKYVYIYLNIYLIIVLQNAFRHRPYIIGIYFVSEIIEIIA